MAEDYWKDELKDEQQNTDPQERTIYDMALHEVANISDNCSVLKVNGGWIYVFYSLLGWNEEQKKYDQVHATNSCFVKE